MDRAVLWIGPTFARALYAARPVHPCARAPVPLHHWALRHDALAQNAQRHSTQHHSAQSIATANLLLAMFRIVDRYVLRQYVQLFLICYLSLAGLYIVIDAFGRLDHFVEHTKESGGLFAAMGEYYAYRSVGFFNRTSAVLALIAAMFTVTWTQRNNEMTALMAAGVPRLRVLRPVIVAAILVSLAAATIREAVIPQLRPQLAADTKNLSSPSIELQSRYDNQTDVLLGGEKLLLTTQQIEQPSFVLPPRLAQHGKRLVASSADYIAGDAKHPSGYWLRGVTQPKKLAKRPSVREQDGSIVVAMPAEHEWLAEDEIFVVSGVPLELLATGAKWRDFASTSELITQLTSPSVELGNDVRVAVHRRFLQPFMDITLLMLGLPLVVSRGNRNAFVAIGIAVVVITAYFLVTIGAQSLGGTGWIRPELAAWVPLMVFVPIAVAVSAALRH